MSEAKDQFGTDINVGDIIIYPGRQGGMLWMNIALVTGFGERNASWHLPTPTIKITCVGERWDMSSKKMTPYPHKTAIENIKNTTVISKDMVMKSDNKKHKQFVEVVLGVAN